MIQLITQHLASATAQPLALIFLGCALVWFAVCAAVLFGIDIREHRLPNRWTALLFCGGVVLLSVATLTASAGSVLADRWATMLGGSLGYLLVMFVLHLLTRAGVGMGDVKLAAGLGLYTGFIGVEAAIAGFVLAFLAGGLQAVYLVMFTGAKRTTRIAFGPAMLVGCLLTFLM